MPMEPPVENPIPPKATKPPKADKPAKKPKIPDPPTLGERFAKTKLGQSVPGKVAHFGAHVVKHVFTKPTLHEIPHHISDYHMGNLKAAIKHPINALRNSVGFGINHPVKKFGQMDEYKPDHPNDYFTAKSQPNTPKQVTGPPKQKALPKRQSPVPANTNKPPRAPNPSNSPRQLAGPPKPKLLRGPKPYVPPKARPDLENHVNPRIKKPKGPAAMTPQQQADRLFNMHKHLLKPKTPPVKPIPI